MANVTLTAGNDKYVQSLTLYQTGWHETIALEGDDDLVVFGWQVQPGPGNDRIQVVPLPSGEWGWNAVVFWGSTNGVRVDLVAGTAEDGWGGRDVLINVDRIGGSDRDDRILGNDRDNFFWPTLGNDVVDGGGGVDEVHLPWSFWPADGGAQREPALTDVAVRVSADGKQALVSGTGLRGTSFTYTLSNVEWLQGLDRPGGQHVRIEFASLITFSTMAEDAIAAGAGFRWNAPSPLGTAATVTYSFAASAPATGPGAAGFRAFTAAEQQLVRDILARTAATAGLSFTEVGDATPGQMRFGVSQQAASKGTSWLPGQAGAGDNAGDVWMDVESMQGIAPGTEGYQALLHEIGHALGLRHPRNTDPGETWAIQLREQDDRAALSVMSQAPSLNGLHHRDWAVLDVLALQHLYGGRGGSSGNTVLRLEPAHAVRQTTVHDSSIRTLDASALAAGVRLSLKPGSFSDVGVDDQGRLVVENLALTGNVRVEQAIATAHDDVIIGNEADNRIVGLGGNDWIDGGAGTDTAVMPGPRGAYTLSHEFGSTLLAARDGRSGYTTLVGVERVQFGDGALLALAASPLGRDVTVSGEEDAVLSATLPTPGDVADRAQVGFALAAGAGHGTASVSASGEVRYRPAPDFWGEDSFAYRVSNGTGSNTYLVRVNVLPVNDAAPVARDVALLVANAGSASTLRGTLPAARDADGDPVSYAAAAEARNGEVAVLSDGSFRYTPSAGFAGADSFQFVVGDGMGGATTYTATITVVGVAALREGTAAADLLEGSANADGLLGGAGNDRLRGGAGHDVIDGGSGIDTAAYSGSRSQFALARTSFGWTVEDRQGSEGGDQLAGVERLRFSNAELALDLDGNAGMVAQIVRGLFGPESLANKPFVGVGLQLADAGVSYADLVALAISTPVFEQLVGGRSHTAFVGTLFRHVVGRPPAPAETQEFVGYLNAGVFTQASLGLLACQHPLNTASVELLGLQATGIEYLAQG